jgi:hypothetical protein
MKKVLVLAVVVCMIAAVNFTSADTIRGLKIDFVTIGHAGNPGDTRPVANPSGCGAVNYDYRIGKYEITNALWNAFVAAAGAPTGLPATAYDHAAQFWTDAQKPTNFVSWFEIAQFCNYLTSGNKYSGAYLFDAGGNFLGIDRASAIATYGTIFIIPTEDEWYKAAYYKPDGSGYSTYAFGSDTAPTTAQTNYLGTGNPRNIGVGALEQNGTYDMMGNMNEWNESPIYGTYRCVRGGDWGSGSSLYISTSYRSDYYTGPDNESPNTTFRIASIPANPCPNPPAGDKNGDCKVNFLDYAIFANTYTGTMDNWLTLMGIADTWLQCDLANQGTCW